MPIWIQHLLVLALVGGCVLFVARQAYRTLRTGTGKLGACCAKGCAASTLKTEPPRAVFIPVTSIGTPKGRRT